MLGVGSSVWLMSLFSRFSMLHANSPMSCAPTMRPLPFSVWNERRVEISASEFVAVRGPDRQIALDARDLFLGFLDEHLDELGIGAALLDLHDARRRRAASFAGGRRGAAAAARPARRGAAAGASPPAVSRADRGNGPRCRACTRDRCGPR